MEQKIKDNGIPVWTDAYDINFGESITSKISEAMKTSQVFLLYLSENTKKSIYAKQETETLYNEILIYKSNDKVVIPVKIDDVDPY